MVRGAPGCSRPPLPSPASTFTDGYNPAGQIGGRAGNKADYDATRPFNYTVSTYDRLNRLDTISLNFAPPQAVTHDLNSNLATLPGRAFTYDPENRLTQSQGAYFSEDAAARIIASSGAGVTPTWFQSSGDQIVLERDSSTYAIRQRHVPGDAVNDVLATYNGSGFTDGVWPLRDERCSVIATTESNGYPGHYTACDEYGVTLRHSAREEGAWRHILGRSV